MKVKPPELEVVTEAPTEDPNALPEILSEYRFAVKRSPRRNTKHEKALEESKPAETPAPEENTTGDTAQKAAQTDQGRETIRFGPAGKGDWLDKVM